MNRKQKNVLEVATVLNSMGYAELARGNKERARALLEESLPLIRELGNKLGVAHCLMALGIAETLQGEPEWQKHCSRRAWRSTWNWTARRRLPKPVSRFPH